MAPGDTVACTGTYTVTLDDLNHGSIGDTATATATPPDRVPITASALGDSDGHPNPRHQDHQDRPTTTVSTVGQVITFTFAETNAGSVALTDVRLTDTPTSPAGPLTTRTHLSLIKHPYPWRDHRLHRHLHRHPGRPRPRVNQ